jgi:hypothetical protein
LIFHPLFKPGNGRNSSDKSITRQLEHDKHPLEWRRTRTAERHVFKDAVGNSYVLNPFFYDGRSLLGDVYILKDGDGRLATAEIGRRVPTFPRHTKQTTIYRSYGCAAMIRTFDLLPAIDVLPVPMQWQYPPGVGYSCPSTQINPDSGRPRNLPSGEPLYPVFSPERPDLPYFQPLATHPEVAIKLLSPAVLELTAQAEAAWWCENRFLFVWVHHDLARMVRPTLADFAQRILAALLEAKG